MFISRIRISGHAMHLTCSNVDHNVFKLRVCPSADAMQAIIERILYVKNHVNPVLTGASIPATRLIGTGFEVCQA